MNVHLISHFTRYKYNIKQICKEAPKFEKKNIVVRKIPLITWDIMIYGLHFWIGIWMLLLIFTLVSIQWVLNWQTIIINTYIVFYKVHNIFYEVVINKIFVKGNAPKKILKFSNYPSTYFFFWVCFFLFGVVDVVLFFKFYVWNLSYFV